ncbi:MAG: phenylalanine--tRNA ligase subunit beta [Bacteroidetes bacterium]|nr:phenylalanine--tRNA ligase subunit beta [Bacteroidota bacterium]
MKISYNWLRQYINTSLAPEEIGKILTSTGLEVESIEKTETIRGGLEGVVVGEVLTKEKHPEADRLSLTTVAIGAAEPLKIVCGAPNVAAGQKVLVATVGCTLYPVSGDPIKIKKSKIRGQESEGMICAEDELGIGESHDGIIILPADKIPGTPASTIYQLETDYLLEIGLTPNRTDAMSHIGVVRDLKAFLCFHKDAATTIQVPAVKDYSQPTGTAHLTVNVLDLPSCPRYSGAVITNLNVTDSPAWLQNRLKSIGLKPINNLVDITNFVMHECGNPLHAFDLAIAGNEINIRKAAAGEKLITLDGVERELSVNDLVICNQKAPMCIAGVMGGSESGITAGTTSIFLEAAYFLPASVRKTSKFHVLNSDSSFRFERGTDPNNVIYARNRAIDLILEICGGELKQVYDHYPTPIEPARVEFDFQQCRKLCGADFSNDQLLKILGYLDFQISAPHEKGALVHVPTYRNDVTRQADISEEVLRIYGFNQVALPEKLNTSVTYSNKPDQEKFYNLIADTLSNNGFFEIMNNSLSSSVYAASKVNYLNADQFVTVLNPLSNELDVMRQSLLPGGLSVIEFNQNRQHPDLKLYEFGKTYFKTADGYRESRRLVLFITGQRLAENWNSDKTRTSFFSIKAAVQRILEKLGLTISATNSVTSQAFEDGVSIEIDKMTVGEFGWIKPQLLKESGIKNPVYYADLDWDQLLKLAARQKVEFTPIPKTQFVRRDFSLLLNEHVTFKDIEMQARSVDKKLLKSVGLFDVYEGKNLPAGKKSYAVSFTFQDHEKTLQDEQVDRMMQAIRQKLETELNAELR